MNATSPVRLALAQGPTASLTRVAARYLDEYRSKIRLVLRDLDEGDLWWRPHRKCNSIGNSILHLRGNLSLWILQGVGGIVFERDRAAEFLADRTETGEELLGGLDRVVDRAMEILGAVGDADLSRPVTVQGYETNLLGVVFHAAEHASYHTGQIVLLAKTLLGEEASLEIYPQHRGE